jgi:hypothetical protein
MSTDELLRRVASYGLLDHQEAICEEPLSWNTWCVLLKDVRRERLIGYLNSAVEAGDFAISRQQRIQLDYFHLNSCVVAIRLDRRLLAVLDLLEAEGIEVVALKGTASAHLLYPDPAMRVFADNDVLVRSDQYEPALRLLVEAGFQRQTAEARSGFERRFAKGTTLTGPDGHELDVHRNLVFGTFGFAIELDELFASTVVFELGGRAVRALGPETRLLHACYHAAIGDPAPQYSSVRDMAQILHVNAHDEKRVLALAEAWRSQVVVKRAVMLCRSYLGISVEGPLADLADTYEPSARERRAVASYVGPNRHFSAKVVASLPYIEGVGAKLEFLRAAAVPDPEFALSHGGEPGLPWLRRGIRSLFDRDRR